MLCTRICKCSMPDCHAWTCVRTGVRRPRYPYVWSTPSALLLSIFLAPSQYLQYIQTSSLNSGLLPVFQKLISGLDEQFAGEIWSPSISLGLWSICIADPLKLHFKQTREQGHRAVGTVTDTCKSSQRSRREVMNQVLKLH